MLAIIILSERVLSSLFLLISILLLKVWIHEYSFSILMLFKASVVAFILSSFFVKTALEYRAVILPNLMLKMTAMMMIQIPAKKDHPR